MAAGGHRRSREEYKFCNRINSKNYGNRNANCKRLIYRDICGGGNYLTQSAPTNFHKFYNSKILTDGESADDFREVTAAEKAALEASDAKWEAPKPWEIQQWEEWSYVNGKRYGKYNEATGYFELNGLTDIGNDEARTILAAAPLSRTYPVNMGVPLFHYNGLSVDQCRTVMPIYHTWRGGQTGNGMDFSYWNKGEVLQFVSNNYAQPKQAFWSCRKLRKILGFDGSCGSSATALQGTFGGCVALETAEVRQLWHDVSFADSPKLSVESVEYMIRNRRRDGSFGTTPFTITLHPQAYARVTDEIFAAAAEKQITIAST